MPPDQFHPVQIQLGIRYSTVLILHEGLKASVRATLPDIVVPRKDNFWRVGVRTDCQIESEPDERREGGAVKKQENWVEQLYISPIGQAPQVPTAFYDPQTPCPAQLMADFKKGQDSRQTKEKAQYTDQGRFGPCMYSMIAIMSVTPSFVSTRYHGGNFGCETHGFSWTDRASVSRLDDGAPVQYSHLLGDDGWQEYNRVLIESGKDLESSGLNCGIHAAEHLDPSDPLRTRDIGWDLEREKGKWAAEALYQPGNALCQYGGRLSLALPKELVGDDVLRPDWASLEMQIKGLKDAFTSPTGDLVVAVTESKMEVYALNGQQVGKKLLALPADRVVMVQWATGKYVKAWASELQKWQRNGLPPSAIRKQQDNN